MELPRVDGTLGTALGEWMHYRVPAGEGEHRHSPKPGYSRYAFRTKARADEFMGSFGGRYLDATPKGRR